MRKTSMIAAVFISSILPFASLSSAQPRDWGPYPMMGMNWMWSSMGIGMMLFMLIFWALLIVGAVALIRWLWSGGSISKSSGVESAEDILKKRYAKGEIDKQEYETKMEDIRKF